MSFFLPSLLMVIAQRNSVLRRMFLKLVQYVGDHPKGPLIAVAEAVNNIARSVIDVFKQA